MAICIDKENKIFNLKTPNTSYILGIYADKLPVHIHYGKRIDNNLKLDDFVYTGIKCLALNYDYNGMFVCDEGLPHEYPVYGSSDLRTPAFHAKYSDGSRITDWEYAGYNVYAGKKPLKGLPATYVESESEADTLEIELKDKKTGLTAVLQYTVFANYDAVTRSVYLKNCGTKDIFLCNVQSVSVDFAGKDYKFTHLDGNWAEERHIHTTELQNGSFSIDSKRGASSHMFNPFMIISSKNTTETAGDAYGFSLVYSGNFVAGASVDSFDMTRVYMGINPFDFSWKLEPGEDFQAPEAVMVYSPEGTGKMSRTYHRLYRERLCRGKYRDAERPVLINNWEGTYFDFNEDKILSIAKKAKEVGIELMVLDDGWFGERNDDKTSLGDWYVNRSKLPNGIDGLAKKINDIGMNFGLWFEPEMISQKSELYSKHPEWCIQVPGRKMSRGRNQYVLDLSREDVCRFITDTLADYLENASVSYIKWDMNRYISEAGSELLPADRQGEFFHRYILGLYKILGELTERFPDVLFEGCSSGGGRFDPGMLYYSPQIWTSDCSDAVERLYIQHGTSMVYPFCTMGAHVSASPNHQTRRASSMKIRGDAAIAGQFGFELDITAMSDEEIDEMKDQIKRYKELRSVFHKGDLYRLQSPFDSNRAVWEFVSEDGNTVVLCIFRIMNEIAQKGFMIKLLGIDGDAVYTDIDTDKQYGGDSLKNIGLNTLICFNEPGDFKSKIMVFKKNLKKPLTK